MVTSNGSLCQDYVYFHFFKELFANRHQMSSVPLGYALSDP